MLSDQDKTTPARTIEGKAALSLPFRRAFTPFLTQEKQYCLLTYAQKSALRNSTVINPLGIRSVNIID